MITARIMRMVSNQQDVVILEERTLTNPEPKIILRAYVSPDDSKVRVYLPELQNFAQPWIRVDEHVIDFDRDPVKAQEDLRKREKRNG